MKKILLSICLLFTNPFIAQANQEVSIFKNGTAFFVKKINLQPKNNQITINNLPDAILGTIWFNSSNNNIQSIISEIANLPLSTKVNNQSDLLRANIGKKLKIIFHSGDSLIAQVESVENELVFLKVNQSFISTAISDIKMLEFYEKPDSQFLKDQEKRLIKLDLKKSVAKQDIEMMYMQGNIGWLPNYIIEMETDKIAKLSLNANIINDAEDLENASLSLVVGVPNFMYAGLKSPLTSTQDFNELIRMMEGQGITSNISARSNLSNIMTQSVNNYASADESQVLSNENNFSQQEDLYFYRIPNISLKKSARANFEIFSAKLNYEHIYETELDSNQNRNYYNDETPSKELPKVWHSIEINNTTTYPFTTGTAMVVRKEKNLVKPISQDKLNYTPVKSKVKVKLTSSPDITIKPTEEETSRTENIHLKDNNYYDQVFIQSKVLVKNSKKEAIKLNITRNITGSFLNSNYNPNITSLNIYQAQNKTSKLEWNVNLKSGEKKEIVYNYSLHIRR